VDGRVQFESEEAIDLAVQRTPGLETWRMNADRSTAVRIDCAQKGAVAIDGNGSVLDEGDGMVNLKISGEVCVRVKF
jgi:hypothetical protein